MAIKYEKNTARLTDFVTVEDAEGLLEWLQTQPRRKLDLSRCKHLHAANLQVLMALRPTISAWPEDAALAAWLRGALEIK
ncbi:hypothetical protein [Zoogloea sp.]|uniref:hypothetical protein n=1 Tax=Zoogloea sp. TaxID=49181 RepID=UPI00260AB32C|nr:hypothetical protein [uncultured Zoogloea sp.]